MSVMVGEDALTEWIVTYLEADTQLAAMLNGDGADTVTADVGWGEFASPYVRVDRLDGHDLMVTGLYRVWTDCTYHVRGVFKWTGSGRPDRTDVNAIGARIDALLHDHEANYSGLFEIHSFREDAEPNPAVLEANGELWLQAGGIYRLRVHAL